MKTTRVRHNVTETGAGAGAKTMVLAHGFGCDQNMWRFVAPAFADTHRVVLFDHIGCGKADIRSYDPQRHARLDGYAEDVSNILDELDLSEVVFVGHSVSAMIGLLAAIREPRRFARLVMIGPSPHYLNEPPEYTGGFERADIEGLLHMMETNMLGWANFLAPAVMGAATPDELTQELRDSFCATDPFVTRRFAQATFLSDNRADLPHCPVRSLIIQCIEDAISPPSVARYVHEHTPGSTLAWLQASGHCPHMTHPAETVAAIRDYLRAEGL